MFEWKHRLVTEGRGRPSSSKVHRNRSSVLEVSHPASKPPETTEEEAALHRHSKHSRCHSLSWRRGVPLPLGALWPRLRGPEVTGAPLATRGHVGEVPQAVVQWARSAASCRRETRG